MHLGAVLVLVGTICAALSLAAPMVASGRRGTYASPLLAVGVVLIGIGVLVGQTAVTG